MKQLSLTQRKVLKSIHIIAAGIWICVGFSMFMIHFLKDEITTGDGLYTLNKISYFMDMKILVPAAMTCLITGWIYSQFTKWGYFKHKWITFKWIITVGIIVIGTIQTGPALEKLVEISKHDGLSALSNLDYITTDKLHSIVGVCMNLTLIITVFISVFKPWSKKK
jgi:hypothetical protein